VAQKTGYSSFGCSFGTYVTIFCIFSLIALIVGNLAVFIIPPLLFSLFFAMGLRVHIARVYNITECGSCQTIGEGCTGLFCFYCSIAQMARHVYGYTKVLDGDGDTRRPDNYPPNTGPGPHMV